jgi:hypothetical protein
MNPLDIKKELDGKENKIEEKSEISIGQQLEVISKVKEIEYQNSLVMLSLERYNAKYESLRKEQIELLNSVDQKIAALKISNDILKNQINEEIKDLSINSQQVLHNLNESIIGTYRSNLKDLNNETKETIEELNDLKENSYYDRKKICDWLIYIYIAITPILFIIIYLKMKK